MLLCALHSIFTWLTRSYFSRRCKGTHHSVTTKPTSRGFKADPEKFLLKISGIHLLLSAATVIKREKWESRMLWSRAEKRWVKTQFVLVGCTKSLQHRSASHLQIRGWWGVRDSCLSSCHFASWLPAMLSGDNTHPTTPHTGHLDLCCPAN